MKKWNEKHIIIPLLIDLDKKVECLARNHSTLARYFQGSGMKHSYSFLMLVFPNKAYLQHNQKRRPASDCRPRL
jgi:hypothetical protein